MSLSNDLRKLPKLSPAKKAEWMRADYLPVIIKAFNAEAVRRSFALYGGERIPDNERNLTDVRTRVSLLIEFEIARLSNEILKQEGCADFFWSYVVANRFPDLEVRENSGNRALRLEVKALQSVAEEKSANFDTLIKDIDPNTDFVVVLLWEWDWQKGASTSWDRSPKIENFFVFHAHSLAALRDTYWLNNPPSTLGSGYQGFDLRQAVNCVNGIYKYEEGNYGKLMRIWQVGFKPAPVSGPELSDTETEYERMRTEVPIAGLRNLANLHLPSFSKTPNVSDVVHNGRVVGCTSGEVGIFLRTLLDIDELAEVCVQQSLKHVIRMNEKYNYTGYSFDGTEFSEKFKDMKPKNLPKHSFHLP